MPHSILLMSFGASLVLMVADELPNINVEASCKAVEGFGLAITHTLEFVCSGRKRREGRTRAKMDDVPAGGAQPLRRRNDGRRPELCRCPDLLADGARRRSDENAAARREQNQARGQERCAFPSVKDGDVPSGAAVSAALS